LVVIVKCPLDFLKRLRNWLLGDDLAIMNHLLVRYYPTPPEVLTLARMLARIWMPKMGQSSSTLLQ